MKKIIATLTAALAVAAVAAAPASAKPGQYTRFNVSTAANGAHLYARLHMDGANLKTTVDCRMARFSGSGYGARWVCGVDTYQLNDHVAHAVVGVVRRDGDYELRPYQLVDLA